MFRKESLKYILDICYSFEMFWTDISVDLVHMLFFLVDHLHLDSISEKDISLRSRSLSCSNNDKYSLEDLDLSLV